MLKTLWPRAAVRPRVAGPAAYFDVMAAGADFAEEAPAWSESYLSLIHI